MQFAATYAPAHATAPQGAPPADSAVAVIAAVGAGAVDSGGAVAPTLAYAGIAVPDHSPAAASDAAAVGADTAAFVDPRYALREW